MPKKPQSPGFIDVFAGCGGLSLGLLQAGWRGIFAIEKDKFAYETLSSNLIEKKALTFDWPEWLPKRPWSVDSLLRRYTSQLEELSGTVDLLVGGPPCQGFSSAGKRNHDDPRNQLFNSYLRLVNIVRPNCVLIENVRGFQVDFGTEARVKNYAQRLKNKLSDTYDVHEKMVSLAAFGVPQARTRYFLIAFKVGLTDDDPFQRLQMSLPSYLRSLGLNAPVSSSAAISDLETRFNGRRPSNETEGFDEIIYRFPQTQYQRLMNEGDAIPTDLRLARHAPEIKQRFQSIIDLSHAEGRLNTSISEEMRRNFGIKKRALRVLDPDRPSPTVTSMPDDLLHYSEPRTLTVRETARLQSFPDWFQFKGKYTTGGSLRKSEVPRFTQVANAVPPLAARAIGELLLAILKPRLRARNATNSLLKGAQQSSKIGTQT